MAGQTIMTNDRGILVALDSAGHNENLMRYVAMVARLNRRVNGPSADAEEAGLSPAFSHAGPAGPLPLSPSSSPLLTDQGHRVILTAPAAPRFAWTSDPDELLAAAAEEVTDVILVGDNRRLARRLVRESSCSVWLVPKDAPLQVRRILVPVDFSNRAADSLRVATGLGRLADAECRTVHVYFNDNLIDTPNEDHRLSRTLREKHTRFLTGIDTLGVAVTGCLREGANKGRTIARAAEEKGADLIVMASRGRTAAAALVLESVAEETIRETSVPLLIVKHFEVRLGLLRALGESSVAAATRDSLEVAAKRQGCTVVAAVSNLLSKERY